MKLNLLSELLVAIAKADCCGLCPGNPNHIAKKNFESFQQGISNTTYVSKTVYEAICSLKSFNKENLRLALKAKGVDRIANGSSNKETGANFTVEHAAPRKEAYQKIKKIVEENTDHVALEKVRDFVDYWFASQVLITSDEDHMLKEAGLAGKMLNKFNDRYKAIGIEIVNRETGLPYEE